MLLINNNFLTKRQYDVIQKKSFRKGLKMIFKKKRKALQNNFFNKKN